MRLDLGLGWGLKAVAVLAVMAPWGMWGQVRVQPAAFAGVDGAGNATTVEAALRAMTSQAAVMFVGTVTGVRRVGGDGFQAAGVVEVTFAVEKGMRGVGDGETYVLREWGGLWSAADKRYMVGSRLLMLLHAPGATGLSSPVSGMDGVIPVKGSGSLVASRDRTTAVDAPVADLRWLAAKLARSVSYTTAAAGANSRPAGEAMAQTRTVRVAGSLAAGPKLKAVEGTAVAAPVSVAAEIAGMQDASVPVAQASVATVLQMMAGWQKETVDAR